MSAIQQQINNEENGSVVVNKATKLRRLPFSPHKGNVPALSNRSANSALKPNKSITPSKIRKNSVIKLSSENGGLENIGDWSTHLSKGSTHEKVSKTSAQESRDDEELSNERPSIFRDMGDFDDRDGMMVLKRANPVYDSDDDEDDIVPPKRRRTLDGNTTLQWGEQLEETSNALSSIFLLRE